MLVDSVAVVDNVAARGQASEVYEKMIDLSEAKNGDSDLLEVDISTEDGTNQVDAERGHLSLSNTDVAENERSSEVLFPLGSVEGYHRHDDKNEEERDRTKADGAGNGEADEDGGQCITAVVE